MSTKYGWIIPSKKKIISLCLAVLVVLIIFSVYVIYSALTYEEKAEGVTSVSWLPKEATDINYYFSYSNTYYEFLISENAFMKWIKEKEFENKGWQDFDGNWSQHSHKTVFRYKGFNKNVDESLNTVEIVDGIFMEKRRSNGGGYTVGYDKITGRAYFHSSPR